MSRKCNCYISRCCKPGTPGLPGIPGSVGLPGTPGTPAPTPFVQRAHKYTNTAGTLTNEEIPYTIPWIIGSQYLSTGNGFTVLASGLYKVSAGLNVGTSTVGILRPRVNGSNVFPVNLGVSSDRFVVFEFLINLVANDVITIFVANTLVVESPGSGTSTGWFMIESS